MVARHPEEALGPDGARNFELHSGARKFPTVVGLTTNQSASHCITNLPFGASLFRVAKHRGEIDRPDERVVPASGCLTTKD